MIRLSGYLSKTESQILLHGYEVKKKKSMNSKKEEEIHCGDQFSFRKTY